MQLSENLKVLLVEDHNLVREAFALMLMDMGIADIITADNGRDAVAMAEKENPDLILMDLLLPVLDGMEASKAIRKFNKDVKILAVTIHSDEQILKKAITCGMDGLLLKNSESIELKKAINAVLDNRKYIDSNSAEILFGIIKNEIDKEILSPKEKTVISYAADGLSNKEIAAQMSLTVYTIKDHWKSIFSKLSANDRAHAVSIALRNKILD